MPRDEFERLERRWREQPLFLPRRRRLPFWPLVVLVAAVVTVLVDRQPVAGLVESLHQTLGGSGAEATSQPGPAAEGVGEG